LLNKLSRTSTVAIKHPKNIHFKHPPNIVFRKIKQCFHLCNAGIGDHDGEIPEILDRRGYESFYFGEFGDIGYMSVGRAAQGLDFFDSLDAQVSWCGATMVAQGFTSSIPVWLAATSFIVTSNPSSASLMAIALPLSDLLTFCLIYGESGTCIPRADPVTIAVRLP
jgi:hypothetical protein